MNLTHSDLFVKIVELRQIRGITLTADEELAYENQLIGSQGESQFKKLLERFGVNWWTPLEDYAFSYRGNKCQLDFILPLDNKLLVFEVKNYQQPLTYQNGQASYPNWDFPSDPFAGFQRGLNLFKKLIAEFDQTIQVDGVMVFVNPFGEFNLDPDEMKNFSYLKLEYRFLKRYLESLKDNYSYIQQENLLRPALADYLEKNKRSQDEYLPQPLNDEQTMKLKKGVVCSSCRSLHTRGRNKNIFCLNCGNREPKSSAIIRSAKELALICYGSDYKITSRSVADFMGGLVDDSSVRKTLPKKFKRISSGGGYEYFPLADI